MEGIQSSWQLHLLWTFRMFSIQSQKTQQIRICNFLKLGTFMFIIHPYFIIYESSIYFTHFSISFFYIVLTVYRHTLYILEAVLCWLNMFSYLLLVFSKCFRKAILLHFLLHVNLRLSLPILTKKKSISFLLWLK